MNNAYIKFKYAADFFLALIGVVILSPVFIGVAIAIKAEDGGKIIFKQRRTGAGGKKFNCYKFRSMKSTQVSFDKNHPVIKDNNGNLTKVGKFIRKFKIDELPQLFNILRGDMCFIAPCCRYTTAITRSGKRLNLRFGRVLRDSDKYTGTATST